MKMTKISVSTRLATVDDIDRLHSIINTSYRSNLGWTNEAHLVVGERISKDDLKTLIIEAKDPILVAFSNDTLNAEGKPLVLGCISAEASHIHIALNLPDKSGLFAVDVEYQSKGIGGVLFNAICDHVKKHWKTKIAVLWVIEQRTDLQIWYEKMGFRWNGELRDFVFPEKLIDKATKFKVFTKQLF